MKKVLLIGLDCAAPDLVFKRLKDKLPNLNILMEKGKYGYLLSCDPPITIPAWMVMVTGKTPGELGIYGFRHRKGNSYNEQWIATSNRFMEKKSVLYALCHELPGLDNKQLKQTISYMDQFYQIIENPSRLQRQIIAACRTNK